MAIGACAVITGTRLIATHEARAKDEYKKAVIAAGPQDIVCTDRISGNPASWLKDSIKDFDTMPDIRSKRWKDFWSAGQSVAQTEKITSARDVIGEMITEYNEVTKRLSASISGT
jgi:nitronate monooxygenase